MSATYTRLIKNDLIRLIVQYFGFKFAMLYKFRHEVCLKIDYIDCYYMLYIANVL